MPDSAERADDADAGRDDSRPTFARAMPHDPVIEWLLAAYTAGDFARVRRDAARVIAGDGDAKVKDAARVIAQRTSADPMAVALVVITAVLLVALSVWWVLHDGPPR
jgi:hypothetical protein